MPLTSLQKEILGVLASQHSEESHFAGGIVLNAAEDSPRFSHDFDIFHEVAEEVTHASNRDVEALRRAKFQVETPSRYGEWEKDVTFRRARVSRGTETVEIDWAADSAFRFFPIERDALLGWRLHRFDVATNKALALSARSKLATMWMLSNSTKPSRCQRSVGPRVARTRDSRLFRCSR